MTIDANADGNAAQLGGNDDSTYVVFGYGSLIFRVRDCGQPPACV